MVLKCRRVVRPSRARRKTDALRLVPRRRSHDPLILRNGGGPKQKPNNNNNNNRPNGALGFPLKWPTRLPKLKIKKNGKKIKNSIGRRFFFHTIRWTLSTGYSDNEWLVILDSPFNEQQLPSNFCRLIYRSEGKPEGETLKPNLDFFFQTRWRCAAVAAPRRPRANLRANLRVNLRALSPGRRAHFLLAGNQDFQRGGGKWIQISTWGLFQGFFGKVVQLHGG